MRLFLLFILICFCCATNIFAQDVLYTISGNKIKAKVIEINANEIKYKDFNNIEGPTYLIYNTDVVLIQFANGSSQIINANAPALKPAKTETVTTKKPQQKQNQNLYYMNPNLLSINALALANGDVTLMYDRDFFNSRLSLSALGGYNFNTRMGVLNSFINDSREHAKKNFDLGLGINFMPNNTKRGQYFVGLLAKYMAYTYDNPIDTTNNQLIFAKATGYQMAVMVTNGWFVRISQNFNFKIFGSFGIPVNSPEIKSNYRIAPKIYLGYCFGYRF
jgi:hypothetical protein